MAESTDQGSKNKSYLNLIPTKLKHAASHRERAVRCRAVGLRAERQFCISLLCEGGSSTTPETVATG